MALGAKQLKHLKVKYLIKMDSCIHDLFQTTEFQKLGVQRVGHTREAVRR